MTQQEQIDQVIAELKTAEKACADNYAYGNIKYARELLESAKLLDLCGFYRRTKTGVAICPFFTWTSENIDAMGNSENDVNLTHCIHPNNSDFHESNCQRNLCPFIESVKLEFVCPNCGLRGEQAKLPHSCQKPSEGEFTKSIRAWIELLDETIQPDAVKIRFLEACDRLDAQQEEIKRLNKITEAYASNRMCSP